MFDAERKKERKKESVKFEKGKKYTYDEIKEIIDNAFLEIPDLDEDEIKILKEVGRTEEQISKFHLNKMLSNMLYAAKLKRYLFEK